MIFINGNRSVGTINKNIYGHFAEHLGRCIYGGLYVGEDSEIPNRMECAPMLSMLSESWIFPSFGGRAVVLQTPITGRTASVPSLPVRR